jgi:hypothetical protein
MPSDEQKLAP